MGNLKGNHLFVGVPPFWTFVYVLQDCRDVVDVEAACVGADERVGLGALLNVQEDLKWTEPHIMSAQSLG